MRDGCPFCAYDGPSPIIEEGANSFVIEPLNPVAPGHVVVIPFKHVTDFASDGLVTAEVMRHAVLFARMRMGECNLITSRGAAATQSVPHLHVHLVPRFAGDGLKLPWTPERDCSLRPPARRPIRSIPTETEIDLPSWRGFRRR